MVPTSMRLSDELKFQLKELAERERVSVSLVTQRLLEEGVRQARHPGIVFRSGMTGRRATVAGGPDVAEIISFIKRLDCTGESALRDTAKWLRLADRVVRAAVDYYTEFADEIDAEIKRRDEEAEQAHKRWERQRQLLGS